MLDFSSITVVYIIYYKKNYCNTFFKLFNHLGAVFMDNFGIYKLFSSIKSRKDENSATDNAFASGDFFKNLLAVLPEILKNKTDFTPPSQAQEKNETAKPVTTNHIKNNPLIKTAMAHDKFVDKVLRENKKG